MTLKLLTLDEVRQSITMVEAIDAMERAFIQLASNQATLPLRSAINIEQEKALNLTMPAYLTQEKILGLKTVSIYPGNLNRNLPSITGFIMLLDASTGQPKVLMDASFLTALRTGAVSGLATKYFARDDAKHVAIIGSGAQALTQLEAVAAVRDIKHVSIWSRNPKNASIFAKKIAAHYDINVYEHISHTVKDADIICTATSSNEPLIHLQDIKSDVHINAIGSHSPSMQEISQQVLGHSTVVVDQLQAACTESGEIIKDLEQKALKKENIIEFGHWLTHKNTDFKNNTTVFKSVGLAIQDLSVGEVVYKNALKKNLGTDFSH
jgi:ornithine cyclodeaminase